MSIETTPLMTKHLIDYLFEKIPRESSRNFLLGDFGELSFMELKSSLFTYSNFFSSEVGKGKVCILQANNGPFFVKCYLSLICSGNIVLPMDSSYTEKEISSIIQKANPDLIICETKFRKNFSNTKVKLHDSSSFIDLQTIDDYIPIYNSVALLLPTTGSTASPKLVMLTHENVIENTKSILSYLNISQSDKMALVLPFSYSFGLSVLHTFLRRSSQLVICNDFIFFNKFFKSINENKCTYFAGVPSHYNILLRKSNIKNSKLPTLKHFLQAGGRLDNNSLLAFANLFPQARFFVMYGQTEATARISYLEPQLLKAKLGSIGKPISGVKIEIITKNGTKAKVGEIGEIVVSGKNVMLGYFNDPEETSSVIRGNQLFTGDLAQIDSEGFIFIKGRKKNFIKSGGFRFDSRGVEKVVLNFPGVIDCRAISIDDNILGEAIKMLVLMNDKKFSDSESVINFCRTHLPSYKVPKIVTFIKENDLRHGKIVNG